MKRTSTDGTWRDNKRWKKTERFAVMKLHPENTKKLNAVRKAVLLGIPISSMMIAAGTAAAAAEKDAPGVKVSAKQKEPAKKTVSIDQMSLSHRRFTTPGIMYPPPLVVQIQKYKVKAGDTWESLAKRHNTAVEIMLRINGIPKETVWAVVDSKVIPENLKLVPGREINVPVKITYSYDEIRRIHNLLSKEMERR